MKRVIHYKIGAQTTRIDKYIIRVYYRVRIRVSNNNSMYIYMYNMYMYKELKVKITRAHFQLNCFCSCLWVFVVFLCYSYRGLVGVVVFFGDVSLAILWARFI